MSGKRPMWDRAFLMLQMHASHKMNVDRNVGKGGAITNSKF